MSALLAASALLFAATAAEAQMPADCDYATCALRVQHGQLGGANLVRGEREEEVAGLGLWVGSLDDAFAGSEAARALAASYRHRNNTGFVLSLVGAVGVAVGLSRYDSSDSPRWGGGAATLSLTGAAVMLSGLIVAQSGRDRLSRAIWVYNGELAR